MQLYHGKKIFYISLLAGLDLLVFYGIFEVAIQVRQLFNEWFGVLYLGNLNHYHLSFVVLVVSLYIFRSYTHRFDFFSELFHMLQAVILSMVFCMSVLTLLKISDEYSRLLMGIFFIGAVLILPMARLLVKYILFKRMRLFLMDVVLKGGDSAKAVLFGDWYLGLIQSATAQSVVIDAKGFDAQALFESVEAHILTPNLYVIPYLNALAPLKLDSVGSLGDRIGLMRISNRLLDRSHLLIKGFFEMVFVLLLVPFVALLHIFIACGIRLIDGRGVFFRQKRLGKDGCVFEVLKYQTMDPDGEALLKAHLAANPDEVERYAKYHKYKFDPRIRRFGRFLRKSSLDELPQFFNVLRGEMSLIGPRPYMVGEKIKISNNDAKTILTVKPGITGFWQVSGRHKISFGERLEMDRWYVRNWSLWVDVVIFVKTFKVLWVK